MSTASSESSPIDVQAAQAAQGEMAASAGDSDSPVAALAVETAAFVDAFERWAGRKAVAAGASIPRLRLLYAVHCHGPQKMADLADELTVTARNVTALVDGLEAEGLVRRVPHSTDRRVTLVELTCNSELVAAQFGAYQASVERLFAGLTVKDQRTLLRLLTTLHERIHADAGSSTGAKETPDASAADA
jgi:DNA-binding MarR family transcriptional regulator